MNDAAIGTKPPNSAARAETGATASSGSLQGKTAIVTGSTSGIGLGIARALGAAGADVMLNGFGEASAIENERAQIVKDFGVSAAFSPANMTNPTEIAQMVEACTRELGRVDILVNNAGIQHTAAIEAFPIDRWDAVIAINLSGKFSRDPRGAAANAQAKLGPDHQHRLRARAGGIG